MREEIGDELINPVVYLDRCRTGGQGEVQPVHQPLLVHMREPPERGLRLPGAGLRFNDDQLLTERRVAALLLHGVGRTRNVEQILEFGYALKAVSLSGQVQSYRVNGFLGLPLGALEIVITRRVLIRKPALVGADPVGPVAQPQEHVLEGGFGRQRR